MRKDILISAIVLFFAKSPAQIIDKGKVPIAVQKFFMIRYPDRKDEEFVLKGDTMFEVSFLSEDKKQKAFFMTNGTWLGDEYEIAVAQLPPAIINYINKDYPDFLLVKAVKAKNVNYITTYSVAVEKDNQTSGLRFTEEGNIIK